MYWKALDRFKIIKMRKNNLNFHIFFSLPKRNIVGLLSLVPTSFPFFYILFSRDRNFIQPVYLTNVLFAKISNLSRSFDRHRRWWVSKVTNQWYQLAWVRFTGSTFLEILGTGSNVLPVKRNPAKRTYPVTNSVKMCQNLNA